MSRRRHPAASATTAAAMSLAELERWLRDRAARRPVATSMPTLDGYVAAIVAGPVSISPLDWICPLLAIDADAFNHGGTAEFAAISALQHHNAISNTLSSNPKRFEPIHRRKPNGDVDARPWCLGFHAAMQPRLSAWAPLLDTRNINHGLLLPILLHCVDDQGRPLLGPARKGPSCATPTPISQRSSRPCANTGCRSATHALADYSLRGCSCRLRLKAVITAEPLHDGRQELGDCSKMND